MFFCNSGIAVSPRAECEPPRNGTHILLLFEVSLRALGFTRGKVRKAICEFGHD
jgi:hypothetical protein